MQLARKMTSFTILLEHSGQRFQLPEESVFGTATGFQAQGLEPQHFIIRVQQQIPYLLDLNSSQGVFLNNVRVYPMQWVPLAPGMIIQAGALRLHFGTLTPLSVVPEAGGDGPVESTAGRLPEGVLTVAAEAEAQAESKIEAEGRAIAATPEVPDPVDAPAPAEASEGAKVDASKGSARVSAGWGVRLGAFAVDQLIVTFLGWGAIEAFPSLGSGFGLWLLLGLAVGGVILAPMHFTGRSLGKILAGIEVVSREGGRLSLAVILKREVGFKLGLLLMAPAALAGGLSALHPVASIFGVLIFAVALGLKSREAGRPLWDQYCGTEVLEETPELPVS